jgi:hypothetical protein
MNIWYHFGYELWAMGGGIWQWAYIYQVTIFDGYYSLSINCQDK